MGLLVTLLSTITLFVERRVIGECRPLSAWSLTLYRHFTAQKISQVSQWRLLNLTVVHNDVGGMDDHVGAASLSGSNGFVLVDRRQRPRKEAIEMCVLAEVADS